MVGLTLRNSNPVVKEMKKMQQAKRLGNAKGNFLKYSIFPNTLGYWSAGLAKKPPNAGPKTDPMLQTRGMREKAFGWSSFSGTSSATIVLRIPTK